MRFVVPALLAICLVPFCAAPVALAGCDAGDAASGSDWKLAAVTLPDGSTSAGYYVSFHTSPSGDFFDVWREANQFPGLQTSATCAGPADHHIAEGCVAAGIRQGGNGFLDIICPAASLRNVF